MRAAETSLAESDGIRKDYETAWRALDIKDYGSRSARFKDFLKKYPKVDLRKTRNIKIRECYYALKEFDQAF
jgi:TolA-binding protein